MQRRYITENIINCRDIGGYPCGDGVTAYGRVLRAGVARTPTAKDLEVLRKFGIKTVIDLRGNEEAEDMPSYFKDSEEFEYHHISLLEANPAFANTDMTMPEMYELCLNEYKENFAKALRIISSLGEPFMFHCFCGKDRTGMLTALLLSAAGVENVDIIADYEVSYTYIKPFIEKEIRENTGLIWEGKYERFYSRAEHMEHILDYIDRAFGGAIGYFRHIGLTEDEITKIKNLLK